MSSVNNNEADSRSNTSDKKAADITKGELKRMMERLEAQEDIALGASCSNEKLLPNGVVRCCDEAIASERLLGSFKKGTIDEPLQVAVFDFDGTCISGSSPKKLVNMLGISRKLSLYKLFRVGLWGLAYKLNLPKDGEGVRSRVFSAFDGLSAVKVNEFLCEFYSKKIDALYRTEADACMFAHLEAGHAVVVVSATFEPIIASAMTEHPIQFAVSSRMKIDAQGNYTDEVEGRTTEGPEKVHAFKDFANKMFGEGCWTLGWAYGDHYSDLEMLENAKNPCAVTPDGKLKREAERRGWEILDWK